MSSVSALASDVGSVIRGALAECRLQQKQGWMPFETTTAAAEANELCLYVAVRHRRRSYRRISRQHGISGITHT